MKWYILSIAWIAQLVERQVLTLKVKGSSPLGGGILFLIIEKFLIIRKRIPLLWYCRGITVAAEEVSFYFCRHGSATVVPCRCFGGIFRQSLISLYIFVCGIGIRDSNRSSKELTPKSNWAKFLRLCMKSIFRLRLLLSISSRLIYLIYPL